MTTPPLPSPVQRFIDAMNRFDFEGLSSAFAPDAIVNDHRCEFRGQEAIRGWLAKEIVGDGVTMMPTEATRRGESATVTAVMDGAYDKTGLPTPLHLTFYFSVESDRIVQLVIVYNKPQTPPGVPDATASVEAQPVYMVYVCHSVSDRAQLEKYWASVRPTLQGRSVKYLAAYTPFEVLEGENVEAVFVAEWPSMEAAKAWYDSPAYKAIRHLRVDNAKYTGVLVEPGVAPPAERLRNRIR